jgi:SP family general alpha glucoside:H+ symporter-like MFS transporter
MLSCLVLSSFCGQIVGLLIHGWAMERFGHRRTMIAALLQMMGIIAIQFTAPSLPVLLASQTIISIPWGGFTVMGTKLSTKLFNRGGVSGSGEYMAI